VPPVVTAQSENPSNIKGSRIVPRNFISRFSLSYWIADEITPGFISFPILPRSAGEKRAELPVFQVGKGAKQIRNARFCCVSEAETVVYTK
jgi:hypothetical protein